MDNVGQALFVALVQEISNVQLAVVPSYDYHSWASGTETAACQISGCIRGTENRFVDSFFPNAKVEVVDSQNNVGEEGGSLQCKSRSEAPLRRQNQLNVLCSRVFSCPSHSVHIQQVSFITCYSKFAVFLVFIQQQLCTTQDE